MVYELSRPIIYQPCLANIQGWYSKYFSMYLHPTYAHFVFLKFLRYEFKSSNLFFCQSTLFQSLFPSPFKIYFSKAEGLKPQVLVNFIKLNCSLDCCGQKLA